RQAILDANRSPGRNTIAFAIDGVIRLQTALPEVLTPTVIDGTMPPDRPTMVELTGDGSFPGLTLRGDYGGSTAVLGLKLSGFSAGIWLRGDHFLGISTVNDNVLEGNGIGLDIGNGGNQVHGNRIFGNGRGVLVEDDAGNNTIQDNRIHDN